MQNHLLIGTAEKTQRLLDLARGNFILIDDGPIADAFLAKVPRAKLFDIASHSFNPLNGIDYKRAREFAATVYTASPEGKDTLTVRNGRRELARMLYEDRPPRLDKLTAHHSIAGSEEAVTSVNDMLLSPALKSVLCGNRNFRAFRGKVVVKLDRAKIGDFDAFVLGSLLIGQSQGQVIVPDFGFYGRDFHTTLIRQNRLVAGLQYLSELPTKLQQAVLSIKDKTVYRTTREDAERLVFYTKHTEPRNITELGEGEFLTS